MELGWGCTNSRNIFGVAFHHLLHRKISLPHTLRAERDIVLMIAKLGCLATPLIADLESKLKVCRLSILI